MSANNGGVPVSKVAASFQQLSKAAARLNNVSDSLGVALQNIEKKLRALNLGIEVWVIISSFENPDDPRYLEVSEIGYNGEIKIRQVTEDQSDGTNEIAFSKRFSEVSRDLRLSAVPKIPELLNKLQKKAEEKANQIEIVANQAAALAMALEGVIADDEDVPF